MSLDRLQRLRPTRRLPAAAALVTAIAALGASLPGAPAAAAVAAGTAPARAAPAPLGAATTPATPGSRTAAEPAGPLSLSVSDVSPLVLTSGGTLTVAGTVRNTSPATIDSVTVTLRTPGPLASRSAVARWQADTPEDYRGTLVRSQLINTPVTPGARATFSLSAPAGAFGGDASAREPQPVGLAVSADAAPGSIRAGSPGVTVVRTFAVWGPRTTDRPVQLSVLVPITQPVAGADAGTAGAHKAADWGPQGRLTRLLAATAVPGVSWAVDPALVAAARDAVGGGGRGQTGTPTASASASLAGSAGASASPSPSAAASTTGAGTAASGAGTEQARAARGWLDLLTAQAAGRDVAALPWADPDLTALAHAGATDLLDKADAQSAAVLAGALNRRVTPLAWPADGVADAAALHAFAARQGRPVVLSGDALAEADRPVGARVDLLVGARGQGTRVVHAVLGDPALGADLTSNGNGAPPAQHLLADLAAAAAEHPGQTLLITAPRTWNPDPNAARRLLSDLGSVPWVSLRPFSELAAAPAAAPARQVPVAYTRADRRRELPPEHVTAVAGADRGLAAFAPALVDPAPVVGRLRPQALSLVSLGWRRHGANALALARTPLTTDVDGLYAGLSVDPGSTKNFLAKEGLLPISVRNGLPYAVDVMLVLTPLSGQLGVKHAVDVRLDANSSRPVFVPVRAIANGDVSIIASFRTPDGSTVLYQSSKIQVRVRSDWETRGLGLVAILLGLLLLVGLTRGVRRGRGRTRIPPESVPDPDDIGRVAVPDVDEPARDGNAASDDGVPAPETAAGDDPRGTPEPAPHDRGHALEPAPSRRRARGRHAAAPAGSPAGPPAGAPGPGDPPEPVPPPPDHRPAARPAEEAVEVSAAAVPAGTPAGAVAAAGARAGVTATLPRADLAVESGEPPARATSGSPAVPSSGAVSSPSSGAVSSSVATPGSAPMPPVTAASTPASGAAARGDGVPTGPADPPDGDHVRPPTAPQDVPDLDDAGTDRLMGSSAVMAAGTLMSRLLGMVRVVVLAWAIGAAFSANAFSTANTLPNSLFLLIGGGVLNAVLVPQIVAAMRRVDGGREYLDRLITLSLGLLGAATLAVTAAAPLLLRLFASPDWSATQTAVGVAFAFWCLPQVFFYGLYTVLGQVLNARGSFGPYMWAPVVNNVVAIAGMVVFVALYGSGARPASWWTPASIAVLAGTTTLGVVAQALILVPVLRRTGFRWRPRRGFRGVGLRSAGEVAGWTFAALLVGQLGLVLVSRVANTAGLDRGQASTGRFVYDTAYLLFMLPHSLVAVSVVTAVFTRMSHAVVADRLDAVRADVSVALRTTGVATVLATAAFAALGQDLTSLLFATNSRATADGLAWTTTAMVIGLVPFSAIYLFQRVFYAFGDARTPFWVQVVVVGLWSIGNVIAGARLSGAAVVVAIGVAMSFANAVGAVVLAVLVRRRIHGIDGARVLSTYLRCAVAAVLAGVLGWAAAATTHLFAGDGPRGALLALIIGGGVLLVVYVGGLRLLRVRELADLAGPLRRLIPA